MNDNQDKLKTRVTIAIPIEMADEITEVLRDRKDLGYQSISDFIRDAIRGFLKYFEDQNSTVLQRGGE